MFFQAHPNERVPRIEPSSHALQDAVSRVMPDVAQKSALGDQLGLAGGIIGVCALGAWTFLSLSNHAGKPSAVPPAPVAAANIPTPPQPRLPTIIDQPIAPAADTFAPPPPATAMPLEQPSPPQAVVPFEAVYAPPVAQPPRPQISSGPAVIYDVTNAVTSTDGDRDSGDAGKAGSPEQSGRVRALPAVSLSRLVSQGTLIPAVLETALNSDLPGYTRAFVAVDVTSFDGSRVLIPRGTHLIGSYKSGLSDGQNRLFVTWTRLIRPDGVSVQLADPGTDNLGRAGLSGEVDSHFFKRFGSAMLLSIVGGYANSLGNGSTNTVVIGSAQGAQAATNGALAGRNIPPTVKVPQGAEIQVFVGRDIVF